MPQSGELAGTGGKRQQSGAEELSEWGQARIMGGMPEIVRKLL